MNCVELGLRGAEDVVGVALDKGHLGGKGATALADGLRDRPQPGGVDVGVTDGARGQAGGRGRQGEHRGQALARGCDSLGVRVVGAQAVGHVAERPEDAGAARRALRQRDHLVGEYAAIEPELPDVVAEDREGRLLDRGVEHPEAGRVLGVGLLVQDDAKEAAGRCLDPEVDLLASPRLLEQLVALAEVVVPVHREPGQAVDRGAVYVEEAALPREIDEGHDVAALPVGRHLAPRMEPGRLPGAAPGVALADRGHLAARPLGERDRLIRDPELQLERALRGVEQPLEGGDQLGDTLLVELHFPVQHGLLLG